MLEAAFNQVYTKFKLHFYRAVFARFQKLFVGSVRCV